MRKILIVGAGQSGMTLAHMLLSAGHDVTVMTGKTSTELRNGRVEPLAPMFAPAYRSKLDSGLILDHWAEMEEYIGGHISCHPAAGEVIEFAGHSLSGPGIAVDSRLAKADWLEYFEDRGGKVVITGATTRDLEFFARMYDLVVVAVGGGELGRLFESDSQRSSGAHEAVIAQATVTDFPDHPDGRSEFGFEAISAEGVGEAFMAPILTPEGPATCVSLMARPGQSLDCTESLTRHPSSQEILDVMISHLREHLPELAQRVAQTSLVDPMAAISHTVHPRVRKPVGHLPNGGWVLGMADSVVTTDPRSVQAVMNATMCATSYFDAIRELGDGEFTPEWGAAAFDAFWETQGQYASALSGMITGFWTGELPAHFPTDLIPAVLTHQEIRDRWITGWGDPASLDSWMWDPERARTLIRSLEEAKATTTGH